MARVKLQQLIIASSGSLDSIDNGQEARSACIKVSARSGPWYLPNTHMRP